MTMIDLDRGVLNDLVELSPDVDWATVLTTSTRYVSLEEMAEAFAAVGCDPDVVRRLILEDSA